MMYKNMQNQGKLIVYHKWSGIIGLVYLKKKKKNFLWNICAVQFWLALLTFYLITSGSTPAKIERLKLY